MQGVREEVQAESPLDCAHALTQWRQTLHLRKVWEEMEPQYRLEGPELPCTPWCFRAVAQVQVAQVHMRVHDTNPDMMCPQCGKYFLYKNELEVKCTLGCNNRLSYKTRHRLTCGSIPEIMFTSASTATDFVSIVKISCDITKFTG